MTFDSAPGSPSTPSFWEQLYREQRDGWELGGASPPLARFVRARPQLFEGRRVLVPGAGRGHDARMIAAAVASSRVIALDFAETAVREATRLASEQGVAVEVRQGDLFTLDERCDVWVEHTCFCALDPARRAEYASVAARTVVPGGHLVGVFYTHGRPGGPPFGTTAAELAALFEADFERLADEIPPDSIERRRGEELLLLLRRR